MKLIDFIFQKPAAAPGTLNYQGSAPAAPVHFQYVDYDEQSVQEKAVERIEEVFPFKETPTVTWINIDGVHDTEMIRRIGEHFEIHPLVLEDIVHTHQRPKMEDYGGHLYLVLKMLYLKDGRVTGEQVSVLLSKNVVISFQERAGDVFGPIRERIRVGRGQIRVGGADYLACALIDAIVDHYFVLLEALGERIEVLEEELNNHPTRQTLAGIYELKREMILLRRSVWPLREMISGLERSDSPLVQEPTRIYLKDVYDHTIQVMDTIESLRDMLSSMVDMYLSVVSNRMNEVMKVLTIIATIFIPPTFVAGIYGMNFEYMPELHLAWGYFMVLGVMGISITGMLIYFWRKKWL